MPSNFTANYQLNQWEAEDRVQRDDFNADNAKIDAALGQKAEQSDLAALTALVGTPVRLTVGHYTGDGQAYRTIHLGFTPKAVLVIPQGVLLRSGTAVYGGLAVTGFYAGINYHAVEIVENGFQVGHIVENPGGGIYSNTQGTGYNYIAFV